MWVGGGEGGLESKDEGSWFPARDLTGWEFATMSKTSVLQVCGLSDRAADVVMSSM